MKLFGQKFKPNKYKEKEEGLSRREFFKSAGRKIGGLLVIGILAKKANADAIRELIRGYFKKSEEVDLESENLSEEETEDQKKMEEENIASIQEILDFDKEGPLEFNLDSVEKIKRSWKKKYSEDPLINDFKSGFKKMGAWQDDLKAIFKEQRVPEEYIYLAIPESHWVIKSFSSKGASGPYQFMPKTAKSYGLRIDEDIDERLDPLFAGSACAKLLSDLHKKCGDWPTALSGYNGGFIWPFLRDVIKNNNSGGYENYLKFIEEEINNIRDEVKNSYKCIYIIRKGDTLTKIAKRYKMTIEEISKFNKIDDSSKITIGQKIIILNSEKEKKELFWERIAGYSENLNYPAKFQAVIELINEGAVSEQDLPEKFSWYKVERGKIHTIKKGEWAMKIARDYGINFRALATSNPEVNFNNIYPGQNLNIPGKISSLSDISKVKGIDLKRLRFLNPAILNINSSLPKGYNIKI